MSGAASHKLYNLLLFLVKSRFPIFVLTNFHYMQNRRQKNGEADKLTNKAYYDALESTSFLNLVGRYMATEDQLNLLKSSGIETEKYLSKIEANRLLSKSRNKVT